MLRFTCVVLMTALIGSMATAAESKFYVVEITELGDNPRLDVITSDNFTKLQEYCKKERPLFENALKAVHMDWLKNEKTAKAIFPLNTNHQGLRVNSLGTFPTQEAAVKKYREIEDAQDRAEMDDARMIMVPQTQRKQAGEQEALLSAARQEMQKKLAELKSAASLGAPPVEGLLKDTDRDNARLEQRKIDRAARKGMQFLISTYEGGSWSGGNCSPRVTTVMAGLAMLAAAPKGAPYATMLTQISKELSRPLKDKNGEPFEIFENWFLGFTGLFFAEYHAHYPSKETQDKLEEICALITKTQNPNGCWNHGYGSKSIYEVHAAGIQCLATLGLAHSYGMKVDLESLKKGLAGMGAEDGAVGYSTINGHFTPGRTAGMAWAHFCGDNEGSAKFNNMKDIVYRNFDGIPNGHASPALCTMWGAIFSQMQGEKAWQQYWNAFKDKILSLQNPDGSFKQAPWADADMEKLTGDRYTTAFYTFILMLPRGNLKGLFKLSPAQAKVAASQGRKAWLGVKLEATDGGVRVTDCAPTGPAASIGLKPGTFLVEINAKPVATVDAAATLLKDAKIGEALPLTVKTEKDGKPRKLQQCIIMPRPADEKLTVGYY